MIKQSAYFIIWNSSKQNFNSIIEDIEKRVVIKEKTKIKVTKYDKFIYDIYTFNNQTDLGIYKASKMCDSDNYVIYLLEINFLTQDINNYDMIKKIKSEIRNKYKILTKNYFHDNIIHGTDSIEEYKHIRNIISRINKY